MTPLMMMGGLGGGMIHVARVVADVCGHQPGQVGVALERDEVGGGNVVQHGELQMAVRAGTAVAGGVLADRLNSRREKALAEGAAEARDPLRIVGEGAVADDVVAVRRGDIEHRGCHHVEAGGCAVEADEGAGEPRHAPRRRIVERADGACWRVLAPGGWAQAGDAAAFLIDHDDGAFRECGAQRLREGA